MTWAAAAQPERFDEAVAWFAKRFPITEELAAELGEYAGPRAWTIAGVAQLDVVQDVHRSLTEAIASGIPFEEWRVQVREQLTAAWGKPDSFRIETIFRNATSQAFNAGRWAQMTEPSVLAFRPYAMFDGVSDSRQSDFCRAWDGVILPIERFAELGACPQCHHRCRSMLRSMRESEAQRHGVTSEPPKERADEGFGGVPTGEPWKPNPERYEPALFDEYQRKRDELESTAKRPRIKTEGS